MVKAIRIRAVPIAALLVGLLWAGTSAQNVSPVVATASTPFRRIVASSKWALRT